MKKEIPFEGSELQTCIKNHSVKTKDGLEKIQRHLEGARAVRTEQPKSKFWKDAVSFIEEKLKGKQEARNEVLL